MDVFHVFEIVQMVTIVQRITYTLNLIFGHETWPAKIYGHG